MHKTQFEFRPPTKMILTWIFAAALLFAFASLPWIAILRSDRIAPVNIGYLLIVAWSLGPFCLSTLLIFHAVCRVRLVAEAGLVFRRTRLFRWRQDAKLQFDRVYLVNYRQHQHRRIDEQLTVFLRRERQISILANEGRCDRIEELFAWLKSSTNAKSIDLRNHGAIGGFNPRFLTKGNTVKQPK